MQMQASGCILFAVSITISTRHKEYHCQGIVFFCNITLKVSVYVSVDLRVPLQ